MNKIRYTWRKPNGPLYFRVNGKIRCQLPEPDAANFRQAYDKAMADLRGGKYGRKPQAVGRPTGRIMPSADGLVLRNSNGTVLRYLPPTVGWFIDEYLRSDLFQPQSIRHPSAFAAGTQYNYRKGFDILRRELGAAILADFEPETVDLYTAKVSRDYSTSTAHLQKLLISNLWEFAKGYREFERNGKSNPTHDAAVRYKVGRPHEPWPDDVQDRFLAACDANLYLAFHLLLCTGQRVSDVAKMKWSQFDGTHIRLTQQKTKTPMTIKVPKILLTLLADHQRVDEHILTHAWGGPYTRDSLGHRIKDVLKANGDAAYTTHGLRKNAGILLAEAGASVSVIQACLGHRTPKMALYYVALANQRTLNEQGIELMDKAFEERAGRKVSARRARMRAVK